MQSHRGKPSVQVLDFAPRADGPGGTTALTEPPESVSVDTPGGHEAEDLVRDIIFLSERLIHHVVRSEV